MKKIVFIVVMLLLSSQSLALSGVTKDNYVACKSLTWLNDMIDFNRNNDRAAYQAYLSSRKCITLSRGRRVEITEAPGIYGTKTGFVLNRVKYWTLKEAIDID